MKIIKPLALAITTTSLLAACSESTQQTSSPAADQAPALSFEEDLQTQLIQAQPGDIIEIPAGVHEMTGSWYRIGGF